MLKSYVTTSTHLQGAVSFAYFTRCKRDPVYSIWSGLNGESLTLTGESVRRDPGQGLPADVTVGRSRVTTHVPVVVSWGHLMVVHVRLKWEKVVSIYSWETIIHIEFAVNLCLQFCLWQQLRSTVISSTVPDKLLTHSRLFLFWRENTWKRNSWHNSFFVFGTVDTDITLCFSK